MREIGPWYDSSDPDRVARHAIPRVWAWVIATLVVFAVVAGGFWAFNVAASGIKGEGDAIRTKNEAANRIRQQEGFEARWQDILATDRKLGPLKAAADVDPTDRTAQQTYTGTQSYCLSAVGEYNAQARKFTAEEFRAADLPAVIDNNDPTTDCKPQEN